MNEGKTTPCYAQSDRDKSPREMFSAFICSSPAVFQLCFSSSPPRVLSHGARNLPRPPELCAALDVQRRAQEAALMHDFPSAPRPTWTGTSAIIFCHYSFQSRRRAEIQTILAEWRARNKWGKKGGGECESGVCDSRADGRLVSRASHLSWNCLDGTRPARGLASPSSPPTFNHPTCIQANIRSLSTPRRDPAEQNAVFFLGV
uniref:Uncharacterized protein n=1 Tax=Salarias fasciatus TaxID=181472 RepID=A0A672JHM9_SALFA